MEASALSNSWTRKADKKVLQEQFLCTFGKWYKYLNIFSELTRKIHFFLDNFDFKKNLQIFSWKINKLNKLKVPQPKLEENLSFPTSNLLKCAPGAVSATAKVCNS